MMLKKWHLIVSDYKHGLVSDETKREENSVELFVILMDSDLKSNDHVEMICKKAFQKRYLQISLHFNWKKE